MGGNKNGIISLINHFQQENYPKSYESLFWLEIYEVIKHLWLKHHEFINLVWRKNFIYFTINSSSLKIMKY